MSIIVAVDADTGEAFMSAAYAGELLKAIRAIEAELMRVCAQLERIEQSRPLTSPPIVES